MNSSAKKHAYSIPNAINDSLLIANEKGWNDALLPLL